MTMNKIEAYNERIEAEINNGYSSMCGDIDYNRDRQKIFRYFINNMLKRTLGMFEYKNLPPTLSARSIEKYLQSSGTCLIVNVTEDMILNPEAKGQAGLYALPCKAGGRMNADYLPTTAVCVSSWLGFSGTFDLMKKEAVYAWNDSLLEGLAKMFSLYASELTDNVVTLHFQEVHNRILSIVKACSEDERKDAKAFFSDYENGLFGALMSEDFIETLKNQRVEPFKGSSVSSIKDTLEARQWLLAHWNIELGLNDNYNMKRESLNENEIEANSDTLTPLMDDMLKCRRKMCEEINAIFGTDISVDFSSSWKRVHKREKNAQKIEDAQVDIIEKQAEEAPIEETQTEPTEPTEPQGESKPQEGEE